jgi:hypothetical protein
MLLHTYICVHKRLEPNDHKQYHHCSLVTPVSTYMKHVPLLAISFILWTLSASKYMVAYALRFVSWAYVLQKNTQTHSPSHYLVLATFDPWFLDFWTWCCPLLIHTLQPTLKRVSGNMHKQTQLETNRNMYYIFYPKHISPFVSTCMRGLWKRTVKWNN